MGGVIYHLADLKRHSIDSKDMIGSIVCITKTSGDLVRLISSSQNLERASGETVQDGTQGNTIIPSGFIPIPCTCKQTRLQ